MKKFISVYRGRFAAALAIATIALLTACGGGGGGGSTPDPVTPPVTCTLPQVNVNGTCTTPAPAPVANISVTPESCTIASGESKTTVNVTYATANATTVRLVNSLGSTLSTAQSAGVNVDAFIGINDYQLTASGSGGTVVQSAKATCTCASGSVATLSGCTTVDRTGPTLSLRASTPAFTTASNFVSALMIIDANEVIGATASGIPLGTMAVRDSMSATTTITVGFTDVTRKAVQLVASGLVYAKAYTATFTLPDLSGNTATFVVPFTTPSATPTVLHYTDKVYAVWTGGQLYSVSKTDVKLLTNKTSFTAGFFPLFNCWLPASGPLADGKVLASCQDAATFRRHYLYIDPTKGELYEYTGTVPANLTCAENADKSWTCPAGTSWVSVQSTPLVGSPANSVAATRVSDGWYYNTNANNYAVFFLTSATGNILTVKDGTGVEDVVKLLMTFSH